MAGALELISRTTLSTTQTSITVSSIPATYQDLRIVFTCATGTSGAIVGLRFNGDTGTNYSDTAMSGYGGGYVTYNETGQAKINLNGTGTTDGTIPTMFTVDVFAYAGSTHKSALLTTSSDRNGTGPTVERYSASWRSTAAINSLTLITNGYSFASGTALSVYGIAG